MNHMTLAGNLGADPEVRFTGSGQKVTVLRLAARARKGKEDNTIWWRVTVWGEQFDKMMPYLKKGSALVVMGEMKKPEIFNDREGKPQISLEMTAYNLSFSPFGKGDRANQEGSASPSFEPSFNTEGSAPGTGFQSGSQTTTESAETTAAQGADMGNFSDEEIPF